MEFRVVGVLRVSNMPDVLCQAGVAALNVLAKEAVVVSVGLLPTMRTLLNSLETYVNV